ncbi:hypothetical protein NW762_001630 [Fusarium torreyae]|uniref:CENP-V/GFA domain-containing protein n=1 Tax=Fusarium torreyae TaxID=1237075 RepID=A0A9W8VP37_9HYPO|nr:hypothetical protein NW762_001630 [Fusarium torreyae]
MHQISCLCGSVSTKVDSQTSTSDSTIDVSLCHCNDCRHTTGLLCTSYFPIEKPDLSENLNVFKGSDGSYRHFCSTCGCHIYRSVKGDDGDVTWGVATGVVTSSDSKSEKVRFTTHTYIEDTVDGGASIWLPLDGQQSSSRSNHLTQKSTSLNACCACGGVELLITRPNEASRSPQRGHTDLMYPYCSTDESITKNPSDEKWWIQGDKYLAGTCACESCRLASGFEIQTWAFMPLTNISILTHESPGTGVPLDFGNLPAGTLKGYQSSRVAVRHFCGVCGATVFWREISDPSVVDVSVGLLRADEGARAESWLRWWTERISFSEEVQTHRSGSFAAAAQSLIDNLSSGLKTSSLAREDE